MGERIVSLGPSGASLNRNIQLENTENVDSLLRFGLINDRPYVEDCFIRTYGRTTMTVELSEPSLRAACPRPGIAIEYIK